MVFYLQDPFHAVTRYNIFVIQVENGSGKVTFLSLNIRRHNILDFYSNIDITRLVYCL